MAGSQWAEEALRKWRSDRAPEALGELLKAQRDRAYSLAVRLGAPPEDAEDVVQEAFVKLMSREKGFESLADFDCAVSRAVFQCSMDALRRGKRRAKREARAGLEAAGIQAATTATEAEMSGTELNEMRARLRTAVQDLPEETRAPAVLCYYQGLSEKQAAEVLELPRSTLRRRLSQAVGDLRGRLGSDGKRLGVGLLVGLMLGEGVLAAPASLCLALDRVLPGRPCAEVPALAGPSTVPVVPAASGALKAAVAAGVCLACAALVALGLRTAGPWRSPGRDIDHQEQVPTASRPAGAGVRPEDGFHPVAVPRDQKEEEEMRGKLSGLATVAGGLILSGLAGAAEPNAEVAAAIAKIQARQTAKAEAAAKDAAERAELAKKYGYGEYGQYKQ